MVDPAASHDSNADKIRSFREVTGVLDDQICTNILDAHDWDVEQAIQTFLVSDGYGLDAPGASLGARMTDRDMPSASEPQLRWENAGPRVRARGTASGSREAASSSRDSPTEGLPARHSHGRPAPPTAPGLGAIGSVGRLATALLHVAGGVVGGAVGAGASVVRHGCHLLPSALTSLVISPEQSPAAAAAEFIREMQAHAAAAAAAPGGDPGSLAPPFLATSFEDALRSARDRFRFLLVYLHSAEHGDTAAFCRATLCAPAFVAYVSENFAVWGGDVRRPDAFRQCGVLRVTTFPYLAVLGHLQGQLKMLAVVEGPQGAPALIRMLGEVLESHGASLVAARAEVAEREHSRRLRAEQEDLYQRSLEEDRAREAAAREAREAAEREAAEARRKEEEAAAEARAREEAEARLTELIARRAVEKSATLPPEVPKGAEGGVDIVVRLPDGTRANRRFHKDMQVSTLYDWVDSLGKVQLERYNLVTSFPRQVLAQGSGQGGGGRTVAEAGLCPAAALFIEEQSA
eukprot:jgi/Mesvir1/5298/Mv15398-RA.1